MAQGDDLDKIYSECSNGYHKVDDFRGKLLGFLPLASGIGIFGALYTEIKPIPDSNVALGIFGILVTIGLLIYELKGITKCTQFIFLGKWIERKMVENRNSNKVPQGYFTELSKGQTGHLIITEPVASAIIYSTVIAAWAYVTFFKISCLKYFIPTTVFLFFFIFIYAYWRVVLTEIKSSFESNDEPSNVKNLNDDLTNKRTI